VLDRFIFYVLIILRNELGVAWERENNILHPIFTLGTMGPKKGPVFAKQMAAAHAWQYVPRKCFSIQRWRFTSTKYK
jgi:hypothetical protein